MLHKIKKTNSKGFTIIEVMIVLAIAALILLIVLLAVPALQRSANNTSRKNDASAIASGISNSINDNSGNPPSGVSASSTRVLTITNVAGNETVNLGYYAAANVKFYTVPTGTSSVTGEIPASAGTTGSTPTQTNVTTDSVDIISGVSCNGSASANAEISASSVSIWYVTDTGSGNGTLQCVDAS